MNISSEPVVTSTLTSSDSNSAPLPVTKRNINLSKWNILFDKNANCWISFTPYSGQIAYPCYACRDIFRSKNSFVDHINRRSILLKYRCPNCPNGVLLFYNPCAFLLHARQHFSLIYGEIYLSRLEVCTLPNGLGGFLPHPGISTLYEVEENRIAENIYINSRFYGPNLSDKGNAVVKMQPCELFFLYASSPTGKPITLVLKQISSNIPCCQFITWDNSQVKTVHTLLQKASGQNTGRSAPVKKVNVDAGKAQETGKEGEKAGTVVLNGSDNVSDLIQSHASAAAGENFGVCRECKQPQKVPMSQHFLGDNKPINIDLACPACKFIAATNCALESHKRTHKKQPPFICPECGREFKTWESLKNHMDETCFHLSKQVRYKCPAVKCTKIYAQALPFAAHFKRHITLLWECTRCDETFPNKMEFDAHRSVVCVLRRAYKCSVCDEKLSEEEVDSHIRSHISDLQLGNYIYSCSKCRSVFRSTFRFSTHIQRCSRVVDPNKTEKPLISYIISCSSCNALIKCHSQAEMKSTKTCSKCIAAATTEFNKPINLLLFDEEENCLLCREHVEYEFQMKHTKKCKYWNVKVHVKRRNFKDEIAKMRRSTSDSDAEGVSKKKKRRFLVKIKKPEALMDKEFPTDPVEFDGIYRCEICEFTDASRDAFHAHIRTHRDVSTSYQCMDCGECFVVRPSLVKHLRYFHQIDDVDAYFEHNDCYDRDAVEELHETMRLVPGETKGPVGENQCRVCLKQFDDESELKKHFRVHGMAFLFRNVKAT